MVEQSAPRRLTESPWESVFAKYLGPSVGPTVLGPTIDPRKCCFCLESEPLVRFRSDAHVVPEGLGNRTLFSTEECDGCNALGSNVENDLARILDGPRLAAMVPTKNARYKHRRTKTSTSYIEVHPRDRKLWIAPDREDSSVRLRRTHGGYDVTAAVSPFKPANVVKALTRIAWFVLSPERRAKADHLRRWVRGEATWNEPAFWVCDLETEHEGFLDAPIVEVHALKAGAHGYPLLDVRLVLGRHFLAAILPGPSWTMPTVAPPGRGMRISAADGESVTSLVHTFRFHSDELAAKPRPSDQDIAIAAYFRFLRRDGSRGDAATDWLEAEQDLLWRQIGFDEQERPL